MSAVAAARERVRAARTAARRVALLPLLVRGAVFLVGLAGLLLAYPVELFSARSVLALTVVAVLPAVAPRRVWPTFAALVTVVGWVFASAGYDRPIALWRLLAVAALLYLGHTLCALAAVLPYDGAIDPNVVLRWVTRAGAVVLASAVIGVLLAGSGQLGPDDGSQAVTVVGLLVAVGTSGLLGWLLRRR
ncbi:hypothetical protein [Micromonospora sp. WMMD714]|uniref:hypothetical protein n=1 Tax=Micromonospora sp. WMMD714 TaxID=3016097 RepID=UPI00249B5990|nr:hypothetical protein [Micromonospora sp. WMMD714]WFE63991.1 hypothetical protein O7625_12215 [Micromonospora sp. WMMD714]